MSRILALVDRDPFPPRNGETIPAAAHLRALSERWPLDIACIGCRPRDPHAGPPGTHWVTLPTATRRRLSILAAAVGGRLPGAGPANPIALLNATAGRRYAAIYAPVLRLLPWVQAARQCFGNLPAITNLSDAPSQIARRCRRMARSSGFGPRFRSARLARSLQFRHAARWERQAAQISDLVLVQSDNDRQSLIRSAPESADKVVVARNGVDPSLFECTYRGAASQRLLHLGPVVGERRGLLQWFIAHVFAPLRSRCPAAQLDVVGTVSGRDARKLHRQPGVVCHGYVESPAPLLENAAVSVAPLMMNYGLINKVAASLAAGLPCTGMGAFNGLPEWIPDQHGIEIDSADQWVSVLTQLLDDPARLRRLSAAGRDYAKRHLLWDTTDRLLRDRVAALLESHPSLRAA